MDKLDLRLEYKDLYNPSAKKIELVDVPKLLFIMIDGAIEPGMGPGTSPLFQENMQALYGAVYTLKFSFKLRKDNPIEFPVMALEGLWWVEDGVFDIKKPGNWKYSLMIMVPSLVTSDNFTNCVSQLRKKKGNIPSFERLRLEDFTEGLAIQTMHIGPYATEPETMERMQAFMNENNLIDQVGLGGKHHEIYMGDPRRGDPQKLKTVLRHPVTRSN